MVKNALATIGSKSFEDLKKINEHGAEYWSARDVLITLPKPAN